MTREQATEIVLERKRAQGLSFSELAAELGRPPVWTAAAVFGQHPFDAEGAATLVHRLGLEPDVGAALTEVPTRGALPAAVPTDPTIYRFHEIVQVYGPAIKALIHEEFGDGIMSAINFSMDLEREPHEDGDRVKVTMSGKFLPYQWG